MVASAVLVAVVASACSGDGDGDVSEERPLTSQEASLLAEVLVDNYRDGGAVFEVRTLDRPGGAQLALDGQVDWADHEGVARVGLSSGSAPTAVGWTLTEAMEQWPALEPVLVGLGASPGAVVVRPPDMGRRLDQVIAIVMGLASERAENAVLIAQEPGSAFLREDTLRGTPVVVLRYGTRNIYWLDAESGDLMRFEATNQQGNLPTLVDLVQRGDQSIELPAVTARVPVDTVTEAYAALAPTI